MWEGGELDICSCCLGVGWGVSGVNEFVINNGKRSIVKFLV